jgi:hypothetical protein
MRRLFAALSLLLLAPVVTYSDHAPEWLMASVEPERSLARIRVGESTVGDAERLFGAPHRSKAVADDGTETEYTWDLPLSVIVVNTMHPLRTERAGQTIHAIEVRQKPGKRSSVRTGAGVGMGASLAALTRAYGCRYMTDWRNLSKESKTVTFIFGNETELSAGFSDSGEVVTLFLMESVE